MYNIYIYKEQKNIYTTLNQLFACFEANEAFKAFVIPCFGRGIMMTDEKENET